VTVPPAGMHPTCTRHHRPRVSRLQGPSIWVKLSGRSRGLGAAFLRRRRRETRLCPLGCSRSSRIRCPGRGPRDAGRSLKSKCFFGSQHHD
jgi:hypothetical protein